MSCLFSLRAGGFSGSLEVFVVGLRRMHVSLHNLNFSALLFFPIFILKPGSGSVTDFGKKYAYFLLKSGYQDLQYCY
jgi:hypothetical protein